MNSDEMVRLCREHTMYTWGAGDAMDVVPVERAEGVYFWTPDGKRFIDFNSQLMSVNIGHSHPKVVAKMKELIDGLIFVHPGTATESRARLGQRLARICPGDINSFFFTLGGAEANENAVRAARLFTGRQKILSRYRSYHGGTNLTMQLTGDPRRWANEPGTPGVVRVMDPWPLTYSWGDDEEAITRQHLIYLEEVIQYEGPHTIAAMIIETVVGTNGILPPPKGWLKGLRALLDKYGILLICDEVMCGFGRTGRWFAFEHGDIVPDMVTMAKGITSSYLPLGAVGLRQHIADHFRKSVFWGGLTYNSHPLLMGTALAVLDVMEEEGIVEHAAQMEHVMRAEMQALKDRHPTVKTFRAIGLFGMVDLQKDSKGTPMAPYNGSHPAMGAFLKRIKERGLYTVTRYGSFHVNPPLTITPAELREGFEILDDALGVVDGYFEG